MPLNTCVRPNGTFIFGIHKPSYRVDNLRVNDCIEQLGRFTDNTPCINAANFPPGAVEENGADWIYEIPNPLPFRGTTFIKRQWAEKSAANPAAISLPALPAASMTQTLNKWFADRGAMPDLDTLFADLPENVLLGLAATSTDPEDLVRLAKLSCQFILDPAGDTPIGLTYTKDTRGRAHAVINNHALFEVVVNNPHLPDIYKRVMVLKPGVQGTSEIVGEWQGADRGHIFEYLRRNSYIAWGHYAANMADDAVRYSLADLSTEEMQGLRHLYYQRTFVRLAQELGLETPPPRQMLEPDALERLRSRILLALADPKVMKKLRFTATLWGWNFGFDFSPSHYRLHASHQQIHQQYAMVPESVAVGVSDLETTLPSYGCGDLVQTFIADYRRQYSSSFFDDYIAAIRNNLRVDGDCKRPRSLIVHEDDNVMLFVPKAQTSQWELQLMTVKPIGNIIEADLETRASLDRAMSIAMGIFAGLGGRLVTSIEFPKRIGAPETDQRLLYSFLPKLPESMGAFSEAQLRWINGHFPEDFADACRRVNSDELRSARCEMRGENNNI